MQIALQKIEKVGDKIFGEKKFVSEFLKFPPKILAPILIQMLNIPETGRHEPCTFFALLLKVAKEHRDLVVQEVRRAIKLKSAPCYYLEDLDRKLRKS